jgi:hypothetical protein
LIKPEDFQQLVQDLEENKPRNISVVELVDTIKELDMQLLIAQNALELSMVNLSTVVPDLAERVLAMCGRTDSKSKKKVAELAANAVLQCEGSVQTYLVKATLEAMKVLGINLDDISETEEDTDDIEGDTDE